MKKVLFLIPVMALAALPWTPYVPTMTHLAGSSLAAFSFHDDEVLVRVMASGISDGADPIVSLPYPSARYTAQALTCNLITDKMAPVSCFTSGDKLYFVANGLMVNGLTYTIQIQGSYEPDLAVGIP